MYHIFIALSLGTPASRIAFSAALTGKHVHLGDGQVVEYNQVYTNVGNGFDTRHSHFIAPVKGIYLFAYSGMNANSQEVYLEMVKNGQMIAVIYLGSTDINMGSQTTVEILERGDVVWVKHGYSPHAATLNGSGPYNTFMGMLLFEV